MTDDDKRRIERINEISKLGRSSWIGLLAYLAFIFVTLLGVEDADFFVPSRQTQLPLVGVEIPTKSFFFFAPVLGAALYVYLHLFLIKLWDEIGDAPAQIRTSPAKKLGYVSPSRPLPLSDVIHPWMINDMATRWKKDGHTERPLGWLSTTVTLALVWLSAPACLGTFWWRSMPAHDEWLTMLTAFCLLMTVWIGATSWQRAREKLTGRIRGGTRRALQRVGAVTLTIIVFIGGWIRSEGGLEHWGVRTVQLTNAALGTDYGTRCDNQRAFDPTLSESLPNSCFDRYGIPWPEDILLERSVAKQVVTTEAFTFGEKDRPFSFWLADDDRLTQNSLSLLAQTKLVNVDLVELPENWRDHEIARREFREVWCRREALSMEVCDHLKDWDRPKPSHVKGNRETWCKDHPDPDERNCSARFDEYDARFIREWEMERDAHLSNLPSLDLSGEDLRKAVLTRASLVNAVLTKVRLEGADLWQTRMEGVNLSEARLQGANLRQTRLERAHLWQARMEGANLSEARMERANLWQARLEKANLWRARLEGANLWRARLEEANLSEARLDDANLWQARMVAADLRWVRIEGAVLRGVQMEGSDLRWANLKSVDWAGAIFGSLAHTADFRGARNLSQKQLDQTIGDEWTLLPDGNAPDTGEPYSIASCWEEAPPYFETMVERIVERSMVLEKTEEVLVEYLSDLRNAFLCGDRPVVRYSNSLPVDAPYPEGHPLAERD